MLQLPGPTDRSLGAVAADLTEHRDRLLLSEVVNGLGLLAFVAFLSALSVLLRERACRAAVLVAGTVLIALGFVSTALETALIHVAPVGNVIAIQVLTELQARIPVVFAIAAFTAATAIAMGEAHLLPRLVVVAGVVLAAVFALGAVLSLLASAAGDSSLLGPLLFVAWMIVLSVSALRRTATT